jgi:hypothetical protein
MSVDDESPVLHLVSSHGLVSEPTSSITTFAQLGLLRLTRNNNEPPSAV